MGWRDNLQPASFRGVQFKVETAGQGGGRRIAGHEWPKKEKGYAEDMGKRLGRFRISGYVIGADYTADRDALIAALDQEGPGTLTLPTGLGGQVVCDHYDVNESRSRGGVAEFDMTFVDAGEEPNRASTEATQSKVTTAAGATGARAAQSANQAFESKGTLGTIAP